RGTQCRGRQRMTVSVGARTRCRGEPSLTFTNLHPRSPIFGPVSCTAALARIAFLRCLKTQLGEPPMNVSTRKSNHSFRALALFAVGLLSVATVWAGPPATRSVEVSFRDLDLSTPSGAAKLYRRIQAAARSVCQYEPTSPREPIIWQYCVRP